MRRAPIHGLCTSIAAAGMLMTAVLAAQAQPALRDSAGQSVTVNDASRIVSVGGSVTEILYALGKDKSIIGIDTTSLYPQRAASEKASVGYMRQLSAEGVLGLKPSIILAIEGAGPKDTLSVLQSAGIPMVVIPDLYTGNGIVEKVRMIAAATGATARGDCIITQVRGDLATLDTLENGIKKPKRVMFILSFVNGKAMVSGSRTAADGIIRMAGGENAINSYEGYKQISDEAVIAAMPDVVITMERAGQGTVTSDAVFAHPAFAATPAAASKSFLSMEGLYMLGFGPRSARAARDLAVSLYPELKAAAPAATPAPSCGE